MGKTNNAKYRPENTENLVFNSAFDFWQEGTSFTGPVSGTYTSDLIKYNKNGAMVHNVTRSADVPTNSLAKYSLSSIITTVDTSLAATDRSYFEYSMEGQDLQRIKGRRFTISFWVKATKVGTYCLSLRNGAADRSYIVEYQIASSNTWEYKEIVVQHDASGSWNYNNALGLSINWTLAVGSTFQAPSAGSWQNGNFLGTANQTNACDFVGNIFQLTQIKINRGVGAGDYCRAEKNLDAELQRVQRYIEKSYDVETSPGTITGQGAVQVSGLNNTSIRYSQAFKVNKRSGGGAFTTYSTTTGAPNTIRDVTGATNRAQILDAVGEYSARASWSGTANNEHQFHWVSTSRF